MTHPCVYRMVPTVLLSTLRCLLVRMATSCHRALINLFGYILPKNVKFPKAIKWPDVMVTKGS
ncbi:hypothetical protein D3C73_1621090 [compost metagenome]